MKYCAMCLSLSPSLIRLTVSTSPPLLLGELNYEIIKNSNNNKRSREIKKNWWKLCALGSTWKKYSWENCLIFFLWFSFFYVSRAFAFYMKKHNSFILLCIYIVILLLGLMAYSIHKKAFCLIFLLSRRCWAWCIPDGSAPEIAAFVWISRNDRKSEKGRQKTKKMIN